MRRYAIAITASVLGIVGLGATGVFLFFVAGLWSVPYLLIAFVALLGSFYALLSLLLTTNTRRPAGIDPNARPPDPFGQTTAELRDAVMVGERPYGRRGSDDTEVVKRLINKLEQDDSERPPPPATPKWALDLQQNNDASGLFPDPPKDAL